MKGQSPERTVMPKRLFMFGLSALIFVSGPALAGGKKADVSWGRAGVSLATYHGDALECANRAYGVQVQMRPYGPTFAGFGQGWLPGAAGTSLTPGRIPFYSTDYVEGYRHAAWMDTVEQLQAVVDS